MMTLMQLMDANGIKINDPKRSNLYLQSSLRLALSAFSIFISIETGLRIPLLHVTHQSSVKSHSCGFCRRKNPRAHFRSYKTADNLNSPTASKNAGSQTSGVVLKWPKTLKKYDPGLTMTKINRNPPNQNQWEFVKIHSNPSKSCSIKVHQRRWDPSPRMISVISQLLSSCSRLVRSVSWKMSRHCPNLSDMSGMEEMKETQTITD